MGGKKGGMKRLRRWEGWEREIVAGILYYPRTFESR